MTLSKSPILSNRTTFFSPPSLQKLAATKVLCQSVGGVDHLKDLFKVLPALKIMTAKIETQLKRLLKYVATGQQTNAENILKINPEWLIPLLTWKITITLVWESDEAAKRRIRGTALQIALASEDVTYGSRKKECMAEMLKRYLKTLPNGKAIMGAQITEQFPTGWKITEAQRAMRDSVALHKLCNTVLGMVLTKDKTIASLKKTCL